MHFTFDAPKDSSFIEGDSLVFSFNTLFLSAGKDSVMQKAYASITLEYSNDSCCFAGVDIEGSGCFSVSAPRDTKNRLKSMSGYIFYFDNDAECESKALFSDLSVKRLRSVQNVKQ